MNRNDQVILVVSTLGLSWLGMQYVHEAGHVVFARVGGETVHRVVLHPPTISRTDATQDRRPLLVEWGGPLVGSMLPLRVGTVGLTGLAEGDGTGSTLE